MRFVYLTKGKDGQISLADKEAHHLKVMRLKSEISLPGICDQELYNVCISPDSLDGARLLSAEFVSVLHRSHFPVFLVPLIDEDRLRFCVEKLCELSAARIQFYVSDHTTYNKVQIAKFTDRMSKWNHLVRQSCQQCGNVNLPVLSGPAPLKELLTAELLSKKWLIAGIHGEPVQKMPADFEVCLIGPEGDFSSTEYAQFQSSGLKVLRFEQLNILRTETAIISMAVLRAVSLG